MHSGPSSEAGTIAGAESIDLQEGSSNGVLLLHGFGDTPQTLRLLAGELHAAGYDVAAPLLPGHGRNVQAFTRSRRDDWLGAARDELTHLRSNHPRVAVAGLSMGGALAAILAAETPDLRALVLLAPYMEMPFAYRLASASHWMWGGFAGPRAGRSPGSILDPSERKKNLGYGVYSGRLLYELWRLCGIARQALPSITAPPILLQSRNDPRIAPRVAERTLAETGSTKKRLIWVEGAGHIITVDYGRDQVFSEVRGWLDEHVPNNAR